MVKPIDEFWESVERTENGLLKCRHCGHVLAGNTSIHRIKLHLARIRGRGVKICHSAPEDVKNKAHDAVLRADDAANRGPDKKQKTGLTGVERVSGASIYENNEVIGYCWGDGRMSQQVQGTTGVPDDLQSGGGAQLQAIAMLEHNNEGGSSWEDYLIGGEGGDFPMWSHDVHQSLTAFPESFGACFRGPVMNFIEELPQTMQGAEGETEFDGEVRILEGTILTHNQQPEMIRDGFTKNVVREELRSVADRGGALEECQGAGTQLQATTVSRSQPVQCAQNEAPSLVIRGDGGLNSDAEFQSPAEGVSFLTGGLVGAAFEEGARQIWSWLVEDQVSSIGIYGMGGVGKTTLVTHINNQLQTRPNIFRHVYWVTIGQDFSIIRVQDLIAKTISIVLPKDEDERKRATALYDRLVEKKQYVLILDDLWDHFFLEEVGIPVVGDGCKLIITTRSLELCKQLPCQKKMELKPMSSEEAWSLFMETLGRNATAVHPTVGKIAENVANECDGLPLGIIILAGSMRGVDDIREWENALVKLKESKVRCGDDMGLKVFRVLRFSYDHLTNPKLQECFLCCALYPEDFEIEREELIEYLIEERIVEGNSRCAKTNEGHSMLNKLVNVCLLKSGITTYGRKEYVKMHDLIRDMALQELRKKQVIIVEYGELSALLDEEKWTRDLSKVSMMGSRLITQTPSTLSPNCPNLSTLLLCKNERLDLIEDSFFVHLHGLKVLDISNNRCIKKLPDSISGLVNLNALIVKGCEDLRHVPSLWKLRELRKLDLSWTGIKELPEGIKYLSKLRYLNLDEANKLAEVPGGILPNLTDLQVLKLPLSSSLHCRPKIFIKGSELIGLRKLEILRCGLYYEDELSLRECRAALKGAKALMQCLVVMVPAANGLVSKSTVESWRWNPGFVGGENEIHLKGYTICEELFLLLPEGIRELELEACKGVRNMSNIPHHVLKKLEKIQISKIEESRVFNYSTFSNLKIVSIRYCDGLQKLFPPSVLLNLRNMEELEVIDCGKIEELIATEEGEEITREDSNSSNNNHMYPTAFVGAQFSLPKLKCLTLSTLRSLKRICRGVITCDSLRNIIFLECKGMKKVWVSLPSLPSLEQVCVYPIEWWESEGWNHPQSQIIIHQSDHQNGYSIYTMPSQWNRAKVIHTTCRCKDLSHVPSLWKLRALRKLDLTNCIALKELPKGIEYLSKLRYLNLDGVESFRVGYCRGSDTGHYNLKIIIKGSEVIGLKKLEILQCMLCYEDEVSHENCRVALKALMQCEVAMVPANGLGMGIVESWSWKQQMDSDKKIHLGGYTICEELFRVLPEGIRDLKLCKGDQISRSNYFRMWTINLSLPLRDFRIQMIVS